MTASKKEGEMRFLLGLIGITFLDMLCKHWGFNFYETYNVNDFLVGFVLGYAIVIDILTIFWKQQ